MSTCSKKRGTVIGKEITPIRFGLGIDAGGTYTDVVIYDFIGARIVHKAKALTTKWDFAVGINDTLDQIEHCSLREIDLICVSTTLATNAIVEERGQNVGLLLMPPYGLFDPSDVPHRPLEVIDGQLDINGTEISRINPEQVRKTVHRMVEQHHVKAFAVSGFSGCNNPSQELAVKRIIREETGLSVTCGHELSELLNYRVRAQTAVLNARIMPELKALLDDLLLLFTGRGILAPVMVVKSDGSLMPIMAARERPIETLLSGPAASVAGAYFLTESEDALIVDMGGTTTDSALISAGAIRISEKGATVGKYKTHVRALDIRTTALGGDSLIALRQKGVCIGPLRVAPVSWLISIHPEGVRALEWIEKHLHLFFVSTRGMDLLTLTRQEARVSLSEEESRIIELLRGRPYSLHELACRLGSTGWHLLPLRRLEANHLIQRCGLTPTDLLHVTGHLDLWNIEGAHKICDLFGRLSDMETLVFVNTVMEVIVRKLTVILLKRQVFEEIDHEELDGSPSELARVENVMAGGSEGYRVRVALHRPVIGVGAAVRPFLPRAAELLETESVIPPHADVANAIGAITGSVSVRKQVRISSDSTGRYKVCGFPGAPCFDSLESAHDFAEQELRRIVSGMARDAGTSERQVEIISEDRSFETIATGETLLERKLEASLSGKPDLLLLQPRKGTKPAN